MELITRSVLRGRAAGNHVLWEMAEEPDTFRQEKMRFQGVKYYLPPHEDR